MAIASPETYLADLNPAQREAVLATEGPLLVVAGAGSGKTRVLTYRVAHLITALRRSSRTRSSRSRSRTRPPARCASGSSGCSAAPRGAIWILTFHAACGRILRREAPRLGYRSNFTIYDQADQVRLVKAVPRGARARPEALRAARASTRRSRTRRTSSYRPDEYTRARRLVLRPDRRGGRTSSTSAGSSRSNAVDFDDLLMLHRRGARALPGGARRAGRRRSATSSSTSTRTRTTRSTGCSSCSPAKHRNVCVVGDPDQSIYGFRGADIRNILEFERDFREHATIALEQNYRSTNTILRAANAVIAQQPRAQAEEPLVRARRGRARPRRSRSRTSTPRRASSPPRSPRSSRKATRRRDRRLLPDERAVARAGGRARPPGGRLPGDRRPAVLRARRDQGRDRLPAGDRQPVRRGLAARGSRTGRAAGSATRRSRGSQTYADAQGISLWEALGRAGGGRASAARRCGRSAASARLLESLHVGRAGARRRRS